MPDEGEVICGELIVARCHPTILLDPIEGTLDPVAARLEIKAKADRIAAICFGRDVPESGPVMLTSIFVGRYPKPTSSRLTQILTLLIIRNAQAGAGRCPEAELAPKHVVVEQ